MIRLAQKSDLDRVLQITRLCAREMESRKVFQWNEHYPDRQSFVNDINNSELYVYCIQDMVIGCVSICAFMDEVYSKVSWKTDGKNSVYVHRLAVGPKHQKQGIGSKLMDFAENESKLNGIESIRLDTFSQNTVNQNFMRKEVMLNWRTFTFPCKVNTLFIVMSYCFEK